jgi:RND family efflux transporter MFP subunit
MKRLLAVLAPWLVACHEHAAAEPLPAAVDVHCVRPARDSIEKKLSLRGRVAPPPGGSLSIASQVGGRIVDMPVHENQKIAAGDVVAVVDDLQSRDALTQAEAALVQARAAAANAETTLARSRALVQRGIASRQELEDAQAKAETARAGVASAVAAVDLARRTLGRVVVRASVAGVVTRIERGKGALVDGTAGTPIVDLAASGVLDFVAAVTDAELVELHAGQTVSGRLLGSNEPVSGTIRVLPTTLDPATGLGTVRVALEAPGVPIPLGAYARLSVTIERHENVLVLPQDALRGAVADGAEVVVCQGNKAEVRAVEVGLRDERKFEVLRGVTEQEGIAVDHVLGLQTGTPIHEVP